MVCYNREARHRRSSLLARGNTKDPVVSIALKKSSVADYLFDNVIAVTYRKRWRRKGSQDVI